jgi:hypothetical protein
MKRSIGIVTLGRARSESKIEIGVTHKRTGISIIGWRFSRPRCFGQAGRSSKVLTRLPRMDWTELEVFARLGLRAFIVAFLLLCTANSYCGRGS